MKMDENTQAFLGIIVLGIVVGIIGGAYSLTEGILQALGLPWEPLPVLLIAVVAGGFGLKYAIAHPRETALALTSPIWLPHFSAAWLVLWIGRSKLVRRWAYRTDRERKVVQAWLRSIPGLLVVVWFFAVGITIVYFGWLEPVRMVTWETVVFSVVPASLSSLLWLYCYYYIYFERPPRSPDWAMFVGAHKEILLEKGLEGITLKTERKLRWARLLHKLKFEREK